MEQNDKALPAQKETQRPSFWFCLIMDIIGICTFIIPVLGEWCDVVWAPISGYAFYKTFGGKLGMFGGIFNFLEEAFPYADVFPSFCIAWLIRYLRPKW